MIHFENAPVALTAVMSSIRLSNQAPLAQPNAPMLLLLNRNNRLLVIILHFLFLFFLLGCVFRNVFVFIVIKLALFGSKEAKVKIKWLTRIHHVLNNVIIEQSLMLSAKCSSLIATFSTH